MIDLSQNHGEFIVVNFYLYGNLESIEVNLNTEVSVLRLNALLKFVFVILRSGRLNVLRNIHIINLTTLEH